MSTSVVQRVRNGKFCSCLTNKAQKAFHTKQLGPNPPPSAAGALCVSHAGTGGPLHHEPHRRRAARAAPAAPGAKLALTPRGAPRRSSALRPGRQRRPPRAHTRSAHAAGAGPVSAPPAASRAFQYQEDRKGKKKTTTTKANQPTKQAAARGKPVAGRAEGAAAAPRPTFPIPRPPSPPRAEAARTPGPQHSLDEVAGALLREALLPAAGQVCGDRERRGGERAARDPSGRGRARAASTHRSGSCVPS